MNISGCDPARLERYLCGEAEEGEAKLVERHLDSCRGCREAMERSAAAPEFWRSVAEKLDTRSELSCPTLAGPSAASLWAGGFSWSDEGALGRFLESRLEPSSDPSSLGRIDHYEIQEVIGIGGMGMVFRARDTVTQRGVAIKTLREHLATHAEARQRFWREAQLAASLRDPNLIQILRIGSWRDMPYLVMPLVEQGSLRDYAQMHALSLDEVLRVGRDVARGLAAAHRQNMVHRDIKPSNVLLLGGLEHIVVSDFGLARTLDDEGITHSGMLLGTPQFMSPEQALGDSVDTRSDLFSLGSLLYWMCTSRSPFAAESNLGTISKIIHAERPRLAMSRPDIPACVDRLLDLLLVKHAEKRTLTAERVAELLQGLIDHLASPRANPLPAELRSERSTRAGRTAWAGAAMLGAAIGVGAGAYAWRGTDLETVPRTGRFASAATATTAGKTASSANPITRRATSPREDIAPAAAEPSGQSPGADEDAPETTGQRRGPLDELDRLNLLDDLRRGRRVRYWLERLGGLPARDIPPAAVPLLQQVAMDSDATLRKLAGAVLDKDPFEEIDPQEVENPFVMIDDL